MLKIAIIVFREILEIALVVSILLAATKGVEGRKKWIVGGISLGVFGSFLLAIFTSDISKFFDGSGQELFNASILFISSSMIAWTVIWMKKYGKKLSSDLKQLGQSIVKGDKSLFALMMVLFLSVLREGSEIVLFSYGSFVSGEKFTNLISGALIGLFLGVIVGLGLYFGLLKILGRHFFNVTNWILVFLCAGMVSSGIGFLSNGGFISEIIYPVWDSSSFINDEGVGGKILNGLIGYIAKPSLAQLIAYLSTIFLLFLLINFNLIKALFSNLSFKGQKSFK